VRRGVAQLAEAGVAGVTWAALVLGLSVTVLTVPVYTSAAVQLLGVPKSAGLSRADTIRLSGAVRSMVADQEYEELPAQWRGEPAFDAAATGHLRDVRQVIMAARLATGIAAGALAAYLGVCVVRRRWRSLAASMRAGAIGIVAVALLSLVAGLADFDVLFGAFHGIFFAAGTWTFPYDSLLIRLFPERFWVVAGTALALLAIAGATILELSARSVTHAARG
jgi:integral membrane protein (TIGR01906 family)